MHDQTLTPLFAYVTVLNALEPLAPWVAQSKTVRDSSFFPGIWDTNLIDSVLYGIPWYVDTRVLFYRKDLVPTPPRNGRDWRSNSTRRIWTTSRAHSAAIPAGWR